jgi:RNA polymerase sigma factor for flagellar operon FliA
VELQQRLEDNSQNRADAEADPFWEQLARNPLDSAATDALVRHYTPLMKTELHKASAKLPSHIDRQELEAAALEGLFLSIRSYRNDLGVPFRAYAHKRVWGAIVDRLRGLDGTPRAARKASRTLADAKNNFIQKTGRSPDSEELAREVGVDDEAFSKLERHAQLSKPLSIDAIASTSEDADSPSSFRDRFSVVEENPLSKMANDELKTLLVQGLKELPDRERAILALHYSEGIRFNEIAAAMEVTESRISQMHMRALERLKAFLKRADSGDKGQWNPSGA